ncbi:Amiloride-sensitive sodium channel [Cooperia oncophora]
MAHAPIRRAFTDRGDDTAQPSPHIRNSFIRKPQDRVEDRKAVSEEFSGLTTYHGLVRIYNSNTWPSRIFWCVVVLSCLSLFMIHSGYLLLGYHSKPTLFQIKTIVATDGISLPDITLCNHNPLEMSQFSGYNMSTKVRSYLLASFDDHVEYDELNEAHRDFEEFKSNYELQTEQNFSLAKFFNDIRPTCEDLVLSCSFAGEDIPNCCATSEVVITDLGFCVRFPNSISKRKQYMGGSSYGFQFILHGHSDLRSNSSILSDDMGFHVLVHEPDKEVSVRSYGLSVPPGVTMHAGLSYRNVSYLQRTDWGLCQQDWNPEIHGSILTKLKYTSSHCEWNCLARVWLHTCACLPAKLLPLQASTDAGICTPYDIHRCADFVYENASKCSCDMECDLIDYETQVSYSDVPISSIQRKFAFSKQYIQLVLHFFKLNALQCRE